MVQITHDNHYVPQFYLKQWSRDGINIWSYQLLVSHENVPLWTKRSIKKVAYLWDLYTEIQNGESVDSFEHWIESEFESPAHKTIQKVLKDNPLNKTDWKNLANFVGVQDVRTPTSYIESMERWQRKLPDLMTGTLKKAIQRHQRGESLSVKSSQKNEFEIDLEDIFEIKIESAEGRDEDDQVKLYATLTAGRKLWLEQQRLLLSNTIKALRQHKWSILKPASGYQWFTSDHPVVKLNDYGSGNYDLKGGWGKEGGNIFMPLSPRHLFFTQIGQELPDKIQLDSDKTKGFQRIIAERALRWIFARDQMDIIRRYRPRHVDPEIYKYEANQWRNWHNDQLEAMSSGNMAGPCLDITKYN